MKSSTSSINGSDGSRLSRWLAQLSPQKDMPAALPRLSSLRKKYCTDWGLPVNLCCSGCQFYLSCVEGKKIIQPRSETHTTKKFDCLKPWTQSPASSLESYFYCAKDKWISQVNNWIQENNHINLNRCKETLRSQSHSTTKQALDQIFVAATGEDTSPLTVEEEDGRKKRKPSPTWK